MEVVVVVVDEAETEATAFPYLGSASNSLCNTFQRSRIVSLQSLPFLLLGIHLMVHERSPKLPDQYCHVIEALS